MQVPPAEDGARHEISPATLSRHDGAPLVVAVTCASGLFGRRIIRHLTALARARKQRIQIRALSRRPERLRAKLAELDCDTSPSARFALPGHTVEHVEGTSTTTTASVPGAPASRAKPSGDEEACVEVVMVAADLDDAANLRAAFKGVDSVFVNAPMTLEKGRRLKACILAAQVEAGVRPESDLAGGADSSSVTSELALRPNIVLLGGGVEHDDALGAELVAAETALSSSGLPWCNLDSQTLIESHFLHPGQIECITTSDEIQARVGDGRIGFVALDDVARAGAMLLLDAPNRCYREVMACPSGRAGAGEDCGKRAEEETDSNVRVGANDPLGLRASPDTATKADVWRHHGHHYLISGPEALTYTEAAAMLSSVVKREVVYFDFPTEDAFREVLELGGVPPEVIEVGIMCHHRAIREGKATAVTDHYQRLTGVAPVSLQDWFGHHRDTFAAAAAPTDESVSE